VPSNSQYFSTGGRKGLVAVLVTMFALQTFLVYGDRTGRELSPLSDAALEGREVWLRHNCQACHQFYGFGGFLGPDLTNAWSRLSRERVDQVLTYGTAQMPPFRLSEGEITAIAAFLREVDATGVGQARVPQPNPAAFDAAVRELIAEGGISTAAVNGADRFLTGPCKACHAPLGPKRIGNYVAPDLSSSPSRLTDAEILAVLERGRPAVGMPPSGLSDDQRREVAAFLRWMGGRREELLTRTLEGESAGLPWWEFR
jgi:nitric oxide reductase subunit C